MTYARVDRLRQNLINADIVAIVGLAIHDSDHVRQAAAAHYVPPPQFIIALLGGFIPLIIALVLARRGSLRASSVVAVAGSTLVMCMLLFVHLVGVCHIWAPLDGLFGMWALTYWQLNVDVTSWLAVVVLVASSSWLTIVAAVTWRRLGREGP